MNGFINLSDSMNFKQDKEVIYRNKFGIKCKGVWKANSLIEKQDKICEKHDLYTDELHTFPTGDIRWIGCPKCREETQQKQRIDLFHAEMASKGMMWDNESKCFIDKNANQEETNTKTKSIKSW